PADAFCRCRGYPTILAITGGLNQAPESRRRNAPVIVPTRGGPPSRRAPAVGAPPTAPRTRPVAGPPPPRRGRRARVGHHRARGGQGVKGGAGRSWLPGS